MTIQSNCEATRDADALVLSVMDLIVPEYLKLSPDAQRRFIESMHNGFAAKMNPLPACCIQVEAASPGCENQKSRYTNREPDLSAKRAFFIASQIHDMAEELPEEGIDFGDSVCAKTEEIEATVEGMGHATDAQLTALENMRDGLSRWIRD